ncbi:aminotransferase class III-fold pyridoxal phosphate-dependent enzyme [Streptomyces carpinensis]|uniref:Aminotransferase class III-fold pyridoxal phosphate-dependent enzyme n=1 Tax=Streptomyces carpinensis TaxID=66369 RepID=A0ABV1VXA2_9ACTN
MRRIVSEVPGPRPRELLARRRCLVPAGVGAALPAFAEAADGGVLVDVDGNSFIDFGRGIAVTTVGDSAPSVTERATAQLRRSTHTCFLVNPLESYLDVRQRLNELAPVPSEKRTGLVNFGTEVPSRFVRASLSSTTPFKEATNLAHHEPHREEQALQAGLRALRLDVHRAPMAHPYCWPMGPTSCAEEPADLLTNLLDRQVGGENVAAVLMGPI